MSFAHHDIILKNLTIHRETLKRKEKDDETESSESVCMPTASQHFLTNYIFRGTKESTTAFIVIMGKRNAKLNNKSYEAFNVKVYSCVVYLKFLFFVRERTHAAYGSSTVRLPISHHSITLRKIVNITIMYTI